MPQISLPLMHRAGEFICQSFSEETNTVDLIWTTGARMRRNLPGLGVVDEELAVDQKSVRLDSLNSGAPFLDSHRRESLLNIIGAVVPGSGQIVSGKGFATVNLSRAPEHASIVQNIRFGIIRAISAGYKIHAAHRLDNQGDHNAVSLIRVTDWEPLELSALAIGADGGATFRNENNALYGCEILDLNAPGLAGASVRALLRMQMRQRHLRRLVNYR